MNFYNNIFASTYRCYDRYEKSPKLKAASFTFMCMFGTLALILVMVRNLLSIDLSRLHNNAEFKLSFFLIGIGLLVLVWKYYSEDKVDLVLKKFEENPIWKRRLWGYISVIFFILQWSVFIYLL
ncbi:hypothetical protein [Asinibacterium sp. OR53]|uniref:hypothetical protein n=1 Tax=Asinibacterium sp. OR53 TaxID=925409 RepID=UPI0012F7379A|nr:hypothetical protein [Asinibacterium sp. OR53]